MTLDVWDAKLAEVGDQFGHARAVLVARLDADGARGVRAAGRPADARSSCATSRRGASAGWPRRWPRRAPTTCAAACRTVGPHRDDVELFIDGLPARTHASQGEQRTLALALRLAAHRLVADKAGSAPVLVLDDVLSELDPQPVGGAAAPPARRARWCSPLPACCPRRPTPTPMVRIEAGTVMA